MRVYNPFDGKRISFYGVYMKLYKILKGKESMKNENNEKDIEKIRKIYTSFKYNLPELDKLDEDFEILRHLDSDSLFILRDIRKAISQKISAYLQLLELFINFSNAPLFLTRLIKSLSDKKSSDLKLIYFELSKINIDSIKLDLIYSENETANFIIDSYKKWQEIKLKIFEILKSGSFESIERDILDSNYFS